MIRISINQNAALYSAAYPKATLSEGRGIDPLFWGKSGIRSADFTDHSIIASILVTWTSAISHELSELSPAYQ